MHDNLVLDIGGDTGALVIHAAVFPALPAGNYVVWQDTATAAGTITIHGGQVTSFRLGASDRHRDVQGTPRRTAT